MTQKTFHRRSARKSRQEGVVILVVLMMVLMASGTAIFAMQSTFYEQKASTSLLEAAISRAASECLTMGGISVQEEQMVVTGVTPAWTAAPPAGTPSLPLKYSIPVPQDANISDTPLPLQSAMFPAGAAGYLCPTGSRQVRGQLLYEPLGYTAAGQPRTRVTISGFGELFVANDQTDSTGYRGVHEVVSATRAYFDFGIGI